LNLPVLKYRRNHSDTIEVFKITHDTVVFLSTKELTSEAIIMNCIMICFIFFSVCVVNISNSLPNSVVNAFKARLDKFWQHQAVKFDFTANLTVTRNLSEEVIK